MNEVVEDFVDSISPAEPEVEEDGEDTTEGSQPKSDRKKDEDEEQDEEQGEEDDEEGDDEDEEEEGKKKDKPKKKVPFHKNKRWIQREKQWKKRLKDVEEATAKQIEDLKSQISTRQAENKELTEDDIPDWFNGDLETYKKFERYQTGKLDKAIKKAEENVIKKLRAEDGQQSKAVQEATEWFREEVERIEEDEELNPSGEKINQRKLLEIAQDNDLIDSKGRWNWSAAYRIYAKERASEGDGEEDDEDEKKKTKKAKKKIAASTSKRDSKSGGAQKSIANADSLKNADWW